MPRDGLQARGVMLSGVESRLRARERVCRACRVALCRCRPATGESALSESAPARSSAPFHRARAPPRRRVSTAPRSADVGCARALEKGKCRRARVARRAAGRRESGPTCCFIGPSQTAFPKTWSISAIEGRGDSTSSLPGRDARASAHTTPRAGHAMRSPLQPIRSPRVAPRAAASSMARAALRAVAVVVRNDGAAAGVGGGRRPFARQRERPPPRSVQRDADVLGVAGKVVAIAAPLPGRSLSPVVRLITPRELARRRSGAVLVTLPRAHDDLWRSKRRFMQDTRCLRAVFALLRARRGAARPGAGPATRDPRQRSF